MYLKGVLPIYIYYVFSIRLQKPLFDSLYIFSNPTANISVCYGGTCHLYVAIFCFHFLFILYFSLLFIKNKTHVFLIATKYIFLPICLRKLKEKTADLKWFCCKFCLILFNYKKKTNTHLKVLYFILQTTFS